jgi:hypothetical protein
MVNVLSNLGIALSHIFIKDLKFMPQTKDLPSVIELGLDDELLVHVQCVDDQDNI